MRNLYDVRVYGMEKACVIVVDGGHHVGVFSDGRPYKQMEKKFS